MNFLIDNWPLVLTALVSGGLLAWPSLAGATGGSLGTAEAVNLVNREKGVYIDVRDPAEYAEGHVAGSRNIPLGELEGHKQLPSNKALPIVVLCTSGARAAKAAGMLRKLGYENAKALAGGIKAWRDASLPLRKLEKKEA